jgi:hydrogenase maturation protease
MQDLNDELRQCFHGRVCLMGVGNIDYGDDGFGVALSEKIKGRLKGSEDEDRFSMITAGTMPERFIQTVAEKGFDHLIFLDAVEVGAEAGSVVFLNAEEIVSRFPQVSTHKISLGLVAKLIGGSGKTKSWLLGVQPGSVKMREGLSQEVETTLEILEGVLCELMSKSATRSNIKGIVFDIRTSSPPPSPPPKGDIRS